MKRSNRKSVAVFFGAVLLFPLSALADLTTGLVAHWSFDDCTAKDNSGNGHNGVIKNNAQCSIGTMGKALSFNGSNQYVEVQDPNKDFTPINLSISVWINPNASQMDYAAILDKNHGFGTLSGWVLQKSPSGSGLTFYFAYCNNISPYCIGDEAHPITVNPHQWNHLVITKQNGDVIYYLNGQFLSKLTFSLSEYRQSSLPFWIGAVGGAMRYFNGLIDEIRIYSRILNANEVSQLYSMAFPAPTLYATTISPTTARLSWNDNSTTEKGFRVQRKLGLCSSTTPWINLLDVNANTAATWDKTLTANTTYSYQIASYYGGQTFSPYSTCVSVTSPVAGTPITPNNLIDSDNTATSQSNSQVNLRWNDASNNETRFDIYRKVNTDSWTLLKSMAANSQSYNDTTASGNRDTSSYSYAVGACDTAGCSRLFQNPMLVPFSPTNLAATQVSNIKLTWTDKSSNETGFEVWRKNGNCAAASPWSTVGSIAANTTSFDDSSAVSKTVYSYQVRAYYQTPARPYGFGYSGYSNCVAATAP